MKQGDIILVDFDPTKGREQSGCAGLFILPERMITIKTTHVLKLLKELN